VNPDSVQPFDNVRHCLGRSIIVHGYANKFLTRTA
jgi:hypothetical protein